MSSFTSIHYARIDGTTWPRNVRDIEWSLRYGDLASIRLLAASVVSAYAHLTDPGITEAMAVASLRRARKAQQAVLVGDDDV